MSTPLLDSLLFLLFLLFLLIFTHYCPPPPRTISVPLCIGDAADPKCFKYISTPKG
jgi:hypothetical protein